MYMSDSRRKINVTNTSPVGRRLWLDNGEHVDIAAEKTRTIEIGGEIIVTSINKYNKLLNGEGIGPDGHLIYDDTVFSVEEHSENTESPPKVPEKKVKRVEK